MLGVVYHSLNLSRRYNFIFLTEKQYHVSIKVLFGRGMYDFCVAGTIWCGRYDLGVAGAIWAWQVRFGGRKYDLSVVGRTWAWQLGFERGRYALGVASRPMIFGSGRYDLRPWRTIWAW